MFQQSENTTRISHRQQRPRKGGVLMLMAFMLPILCILGSFAINIAYLQLTRTELMVATDASARAGGRAFSHYQNVEQAKTSAQVTAALNTVGGMALRLETDDGRNEIEFGDASRVGNSGRYTFSKLSTSAVSSGAAIANAVRISGLLTSNSLTGQVQAVFPTFGMQNTFDMEIKSGCHAGRP